MNDDNFSQKTAFLRELEENLWEVWSTWGCGPGCSLHEERDLIWFETPMPIIPFNGVIKFQIQSEADQVISEIMERFRDRKAQFMWVYHPSSEPDDLQERLVKYGLKDVEPIPGMARTLDDLEEVPRIPDGIDIRKVESDTDMSAFYQFAAWRWNVPEKHQAAYESIVKCFRFGEPDAKAHMWQAWQEGTPVAKAGMYITANSAGIYAVATRPEARRLGLARALTLTALHEARSLGSEVAVLHSTPMAEGLYRSIGFETVADFRLFASEEVYI